MTQTHPREGQSATTSDEEAADARFRQLIEGDIDIRIARDGTWFHEGSPIHRKPLVKLFAGILRRDDDDAFYLQTPAEKRRITVDDAPFLAVEVRIEGEGSGRRLVFRTNVDDEVTAGPAHPIRVAFDEQTGEPAPYILVRDRLEALIARPVYYELVAMGETRTIGGREVLGVESDGEYFVLGELPDDA
jgi:hypothetical protein